MAGPRLFTGRPGVASAPSSSCPGRDPLGLVGGPQAASAADPAIVDQEPASAGPTARTAHPAPVPAMPEAGRGELDGDRLGEAREAQHDRLRAEASSGRFEGEGREVLDQRSRARPGRNHQRRRPGRPALAALGASALPPTSTESWIVRAFGRRSMSMHVIVVLRAAWASLL